MKQVKDIRSGVKILYRIYSQRDKKTLFEEHLAYPFLVNRICDVFEDDFEINCQVNHLNFLIDLLADTPACFLSLSYLLDPDTLNQDTRVYSIAIDYDDKFKKEVFKDEQKASFSQN